MIQDVDETLRRLLLSELGRIPGNPIRDPAQVTFDSPAVAETAQDREARINLYLHDVRENREIREEGFTTIVSPGERSTAGRRPAVVRLDLSYLVTTYAGDDPVLEHRLLGDALIVLLRFLAVPADFLVGSLAGIGSNQILLRVAQPESIETADPSSLWQALGGRLRPAISVVLTAPVDVYETIWTKVVREAIMGIGPGIPPEGPRRPLDLSSVWVSIAGVVVDQVTERPVRQATITVDGRSEELMANEDGFFYALNLAPGPYNVRCRMAGYASQEHRVNAPPLGRPDQLEPIVFALKPLSDLERARERAAMAEAWTNVPGLVEAERTYTVSVTGVLRFPDGRPAANIPVRVGLHRTTTDLTGAYSFLNLPPGDHTVIADVPGEEPKEVILEDGAAIIETHALAANLP